MTTYILAGDYQQFLIYCQERDLNPHEALYVANGAVLRGRRITDKDEIIRTGTYWDRRDASIIEALISWRMDAH